MTSTLTHFFSLKSHPGRERDHNEDACGEFEVADGHLLVVADGMGGHEAGEVASKLTVEELLDHIETTVHQDPRERLDRGIRRAHERVLERAAASGTAGMGTTVVAVFIEVTHHPRRSFVHVAHVGDSRLYWFRNGALRWVTRDHTRVARMVDRGILTEDQAKIHPDANVITRAVGHLPKEGDGTFQVDVREEPLEVEAGDSLVLCSDGLYDLVDETGIANTLAGRGTREATDLLISLANERGGHDNITVAVVHFGQDCGASTPAEVPRGRTAVEPISVPDPPEPKGHQATAEPTPARDGEPSKHDTPFGLDLAEPGTEPRRWMRPALLVILGLVCAAFVALLTSRLFRGNTDTSATPPSAAAPSPAPAPEPAPPGADAVSPSNGEANSAAPATSPAPAASTDPSAADAPAPTSPEPAAASPPNATPPAKPKP